MRPVPLPLRLYGALSAMAGPVLFPRVARKLRAFGTAPDRVKERNGHATEPRPTGRLLWCHAASVGESVSVLRLLSHLGEQHPDLSFLLTSGTATSAQIVANRLPPRTRHQFAPLDTPQAVNRFLAHWAPDAALFVESELWPNMLDKAHQAGIPLALVNARISDRSARNWSRARATAHHLMKNFRVIHCQDTRTVEHLRALGLEHAHHGANLKAMSAPLPVDRAELTRLKATLGTRPVWLASSTHPGEDEIMLDAHQRVLAHHPEALLILVPRHPERAGAIQDSIASQHLRAAQRSQGEDPSQDHALYLADTLGETGLWYALSPITCLCGSFTPVGGHNPFEPAQGGSAILHGPHYANFAEIYAAFDAAGAALEVCDGDALAQSVLRLLTQTKTRRSMTTAANAQLTHQTEGLTRVARDLSKALELTQDVG
ncbi:MAG: 3-deoxy-D-manno-octulosonic acid transferase [Pseudomonadota bacterium]